MFEHKTTREPPSAADDEDKVSKLLDRAFELYDSGSVDQAFEVCRAAIRLNPDSVTGRSLLSSIYEKRGDLEAAIRQMERVVELNPESIVDSNRLDFLKTALRIKRLEEFPDSERKISIPLPTWQWNNQKLIVAAVGICFVVLGMMLFNITPPKDNQSLQITPAVPSQTAQPPQQYQRQQTSNAALTAPVTPPPQTASSPNAGLFAGFGVRSQQQPTTPAPQSRRTEQQPQPQPQPQSQNQTPPAQQVRPLPSTQPGQEEQPKVTIRRENAPETSPEDQKAQSGSGRQLQLQAIDYYNKGDRVNAVAGFRKAIEAYRKDAALSGQGFEANQGIRTCEKYLKLLGESQ